MNRRNFFKIITVATPSIFIPKLISVHWKRSANDLLVLPSWMVNSIEELAALSFWAQRDKIQQVAIDFYKGTDKNGIFKPSFTQYKLCQTQTT